MTQEPAPKELNYREWLEMGWANGYASKQFCASHMRDEEVSLDCANALIHPETAEVIVSQIMGSCNCCITSIILLPEVCHREQS